MLKFRFYDKDAKKDYAWYDSSNIVYSECDDRDNDYKTLRVVFKNGSTYEYTNVDVNDYVMFLHGGMEGSNGKALNKFIKPKYSCERLSNTDLNELEQRLREKKIKEKDEENKN